jgi:hypothetical protein
MHKEADPGLAPRNRLGNDGECVKRNRNVVMKLVMVT